MKDYNGFTGKERDAAYQIQKQMRDRGLISWDNKPCDICGVIGGLIMPHQENYADPYAFWPLCVECHMKLHSRFNNPTAWLKHLDKVTHGFVPLQFKTVTDYFKQKGARKAPEYKGKRPDDFGNKWFNNLSMVESNPIIK
jgi:hypothetical protein